MVKKIWLVALIRGKLPLFFQGEGRISNAIVWSLFIPANFILGWTDKLVVIVVVWEIGIAF